MVPFLCNGYKLLATRNISRHCFHQQLANEHEKANQLHEEEAYVRQDNERLSSKVEEVEAYAQDLRESLDNKALAEERLSGELQIAKVRLVCASQV